MTPRRRAAWGVAAVAGVLVIGVAAGEAAGWRFLKQPLRDALQRAAGVPVQLDGRFELRLLWRPRLQAERLSVGAAVGVPVPHLLDARGAAVAWRWGDLWRWRRGDALVLRSLRADSLDVQLMRLADGRASWQIGRQATPRPDADAQPLPRIDHLEVADGHLLLDDKMLDTQLRVDMRGREGGAQAPTESGYRATIAGRYRAAPLQLALRSGGALPLLRNEEGDGDPVATSLRMEGEFAGARVLFDGQAAALMGARHLDGAVRFGGPSLALVGDALGLTLPQTPPFDLRGRVAHHDGVWTLRIERAAVGRSELAGEFRYDTAAKPPRLSGRASGPQLMLADLGPSIGAPTAGSAPRAATAARTPRAAAAASSPKAAAAKAPRVAAAASAPAGGVLPQTHFDLPSLRAMDADVHVAIDQLVFPTSAMTPLRNLRTRVLLDGGVLELRELRAQVAGGQLSGSTRLDGSKPPARWVARLRFGDVDVAGWLRGLRTAEGERKAPSPDDARALREQRAQARRDTEAKPPALLTGRLEASVDVTGAGQSTAEILSTLEGPIEVIVRDGTMSHLVTEAMGIDLAQALGVAVKGDAALPLACARFDFVTHHGVMRLTRGVLDNRDSTIRVAGQIDLRTEQLALAARARPKDVSPISLRAPVTVSGTLQDPSVRIEPSLVAARALGALALGALAGPLAAVIPLIDPGEREQGEPCTAGSGADASAQAAQAAASSSEQRVPR